MLFTIYLTCLLVGGFFVALSIFGGDADVGGDVDVDLDIDLDAEADFDGGGGFLDLFSLRALFFFATFFGLTGVLLDLLGTGDVLSLAISLPTGLVTALGANALVEKVGKADVSSDITTDDLTGATAKVLIPFDGTQRGKVALVARGSRLNLVASSFEQAPVDFERGDEVVIVRFTGSTAEVVKPD
jgi:membrane protein implicated in regulation of membrane protease activity